MVVRYRKEVVDRRGFLRTRYNATQVKTRDREINQTVDLIANGATLTVAGSTFLVFKALELNDQDRWQTVQVYGLKGLDVVFAARAIPFVDFVELFFHGKALQATLQRYGTGLARGAHAHVVLDLAKISKIERTVHLHVKLVSGELLVVVW